MSNLNEAEEEYYKLLGNIFRKVNAEDSVWIAAVKLFEEYIEDEDRRKNITFNQILALMQTTGKLKNDLLAQIVMALAKKENGLIPEKNVGEGSKLINDPESTQKVKDAVKVQSVLEQIEKIAKEERKTD